MLHLASASISGWLRRIWRNAVVSVAPKRCFTRAFAKCCCVGGTGPLTPPPRTYAGGASQLWLFKLIERRLRVHLESCFTWARYVLCAGVVTALAPR